jgi:hypothetical protein
MCGGGYPPLLTRNARDFDLVSDLVEILDGNYPPSAG